MAGRHPVKDKFAASHPENIKRRKIVSIVSLVLILFLFSLIAYFIGRPLVREFIESPETFRDYVRSHWLLGPAVMIGIMALQVIVAVIPGEPFELGAGFVFGWLQGSILCLAATALASALVFVVVRKYGVKVVELFFPREKIMKYSFMQNEKKLDLLVFMLFLIPGTPKDLLTYLIGLTPMKLGSFLLLTTLARIPSVVSSAVSGSLAQSGSYKAAIITYAVTAVITVVCVLYYRKISKEEKEQKPDEQSARQK
ncbi:MAG: TVP38/TMEM64 family protein [Clostridia bacterium]|nr:TVP38/TMEM64 family protein [Clostridia bacterium]